jgi:DNA invertase Pin-like site-specific DNA recombinase
VRAGKVDVVVAWALDRLARTARDRLALVEACRDAGVIIALVRGRTWTRRPRRAGWWSKASVSPASGSGG